MSPICTTVLTVPYGLLEQVATSVHRAAATCDEQALQTTLKEVAGKGDEQGGVDAGDAKRWTAFHVACAGGHLACAALLLDAKCNAELRNEDGLTGWELAQQLGHREVLALQRAATDK